MAKHDCEIDFQVDDRPRSVTAFAAKLAGLLATSSDDECSLDLRRCGYLGPDAAALLYATVRRVKHDGLDLRVHLPSAPPQLDAFCFYSGLRHRLLGEAAPDESHPNCVTVPLRQHVAARHDDIDPIVRLVRAYATLDDDRITSLGVAFTEVLQNVTDHSKSAIGAVSAARFLTAKHEVRVAIVDMGDEIGQTLRVAYPHVQSTTEALSLVLEGGYSARSRINNAGQGISNLRMCTTGPGGHLFILSNDASAVVGPDRQPQVHQLPFHFPGTGIFFTLPTA